MYIKTIHIDVFGAVTDRTVELGSGLNIIEGQNESGKSTLAMFIKFLLYGLSGRSTDGTLSERARYVNWDTGRAAGYMTVVTSEREYRIERELYVPGSDADSGTGAADAVRERVVMSDTATGERVFRGEVPGVALLHITEQMFCNTVFVRQLGDVSVDGSGMSEAIENILFSGDEGLSTRRAADKLDKSRKALLYKNGSGGKIYDLKKEKYRLEGEMRTAGEKNAEIIELESALASSEAMIGEREKKAAEISAVLDAYDKLAASKRVLEARQWRSEADRLSCELERFAPYGNIDEKCMEIRRLQAQSTAAENQLKTLRRSAAALEATLPPPMSEADMAEARSRIGDAKIAKSAQKSSFTVSLILFILAALTGCAAFFLFGTERFIAYIAAGAAALMLVAALVLLFVSFAKLRRLGSVLDEWNADNIDDLSAIINETIRKAAKRSEPDGEYGALRSEIQRTEATRLAAVTELRDASAVFAGDCADTAEFVEKALTAAAALADEKAAIQRDYDKATGALSAYADAENDNETEAAARMAADTPEGARAVTLSAEEADKMRRDRGFYATTAEAQRAHHAEIERKLSVLRATSASPAALAARIEALGAEISSLTARYEALVTAMEALNTASGNLRANLMPRIVDEAGALMDSYSDGKYPTLGVSRGFELTYIQDGRTRDAAHMSAGTKDMAYISLRGALLRVLFPEDTPPSVFDESFARIDEGRLSRILRLLAAEGAGQSLVFTCRALEGDVADNIPGAETILLG